MQFVRLDASEFRRGNKQWHVNNTNSTVIKYSMERYSLCLHFSVDSVKSHTNKLSIMQAVNSLTLIYLDTAGKQ